MPYQFKLSIVICTYNREKYLKKILESVKAQTALNTEFETIVVNNNSTDQTEAYCRGFIQTHSELNIKYALETNQGLSYARNAGIALAEGEYIAFVDDDAYMHDDYVKNNLAFYDSCPQAVASGGKCELYYEAEPPKWGNKYMNTLFGLYDRGNQIKRFKKGYPYGLNMTFKHDLFKQVGVFDPNLGRTGDNLNAGEEKDLFGRIKKVSDEIYYTPEVIVIHAVPEFRTQKSFIKEQAMWIGKSKRMIATKKSGELMKQFAVELFKWSATLLLFAKFMFAKPSVAVMLLRFRYWVSCGLFFKKSNQ